MRLRSYVEPRDAWDPTVEGHEGRGTAMLDADGNACAGSWDALLSGIETDLRIAPILRELHVCHSELCALCWGLSKTGLQRDKIRAVLSTPELLRWFFVGLREEPEGGIEARLLDLQDTLYVWPLQ